MAVSNSSTDACVAFEKACTKCGVVKTLDAYSKKSAATDGKASECRSCRAARDRIGRSSQHWKERHRNYCKQKADERQRLTGIRGASPECKRMWRWMQKGHAKVEALELAKRYPQGIQRHQAIERKYDALAAQNARQAWNYWISEKASTKWMRSHYENEPWKNPRLNQAEKFRLRYRHDPEFCLHQKMRAHMRKRTRHDRIGDVMRLALKNNGKSNKVEHLLGYTIADLKKHLESQFTYRMTWEKFNKGEIHIDHILPISSFDFKEIGDREWRACWDLPNLRPLWAKDNIAKSNKLLFLL
jgi:hypothetical protein